MEKLLGKYRITALIGAKSTHPVYLARLPGVSAWNKMIKVFDSVLLETPQEQDDFIRKMHIFMRLQHSSILPILDVGVENGHPYVVTRYASGGSLRQYLDRQSPPFNIIKGVQIISEIGSALRYAHARGILHNNIKPENIVFDDGVALLMDFDFSAVQKKISADSNTNAHNLYYPEGEPVSQFSDQYALGRLAYEILTGHRSSVSTAFLIAEKKLLVAEKKLQEDISASPSLPFIPGLPRHIEAALRKATADNIDERFKNVATFINVLNIVPEEFFNSNSSISAPEVGSSENAGEETHDDSATIKFPQRRKRLIGTALVLLVVLILSSFYLFQSMLSGKSVNHSVPADRTVLTSPIVRIGATSTPIVPATQQQQPNTGHIPPMPPVVLTSTSVPTAHLKATPTPVAMPTPAATPTPVNNCAVSYVVTSQWSGGFTTNIIISNTGSTDINGWNLVFTFPHGQQVTQGWKGSFSQQGSQVTITNLSYNGSLNKGSSTSLGFNGSWNGSNPKPGSFILNGSPCTIG